MQVKFGKYAGWDIETIPEDYIRFMIDSKDMWVNELERREMIRQAELPWIERVIDAGYRQLALKHHPDRGGKSEDMLAINAAKEQLLELLEHLK